MNQEKNQVKTEKLSKDLIQGIYKRVSGKLKTTNNTTIGDFFGISSQSVGQWEQGINPPRLDKLCYFSFYFSLSLHWLITGEGPESRDVLRKIDGEIVEREELNIEEIKRQGVEEYITRQMYEVLTGDQRKIRKSKIG